MSKRILTLDVGASTIKLAEFQVSKDHQLTLSNYGIRAVGLDPSDEASRMLYTGTAVRELMQELRIKPGPVLLSLSGMHVFSRYVKLPPVSGDKISQVVEYEAKQNIPNLDEVVWDRQILSGRDGDMDVLLAAVKQQVVEELAETLHDCGLEIELVDVSVASLYNAYRFAYPAAEGCTLILDLGAKTTNVVFAEDEQLWSRSFPVSGHSITQAISNDFEVDFGVAEALKEKVSMVALGGAYEPLEDPQADQVSKCIRGTMTRLHAEIMRSINSYRSQQNGSAPTRILLTGGSSVMTYLDIFLSEKLDIPVEYLNPLEGITIGSRVDEERINGDWHLLSEVIGLAHRKAGSATIDLNLLPPSIVRERSFRKKQGLFALSMILLAVTAGVWAWDASVRSSKLNEKKSILQSQVNTLRGWSDQIKTLEANFEQVERDLLALSAVVESRDNWVDVIEEIRSVKPEGVWITQLRPSAENPENTFVLVGTFFKDSLYTYDPATEIYNADNAPIYEFLRKLRESEIFSAEETETTLSRSPIDLAVEQGQSEYRKSVVTFEIQIVLKEPLSL
jgi:type IV pilus assembly protein PilM